MDRARLSVPATAAEGEIIEIRAMVQHPMETGFARNAVGEPIPRDIVTGFACYFEGEEVFSAEFFPAVAANPLVKFHYRAERSGTLEFRWTHQDGGTLSETADLTVT